MILLLSIQRKQIIESNQNVQSNASNFNQRSYRQFNIRQRFVNKTFHADSNQKIDEIFHSASKQENISKTNENRFDDFYENDDYYDDVILQIIDDSVTNESTDDISIIHFLKIFIFQRSCKYCKTNFFFNNKLHRHLRQRAYRTNSSIDSLMNIFQHQNAIVLFITFTEFVKVFHQSVAKITFVTKQLLINRLSFIFDVKYT